MIGLTGQNLCFILSPPRAGSTLLAAMLGSHPAIYSPPEIWENLLLAMAHGSPARTDTVFDHHLALEIYRRVVDRCTEIAAIRAHALTVYSALLTGSGKVMLVDKTPRYYHILQELCEWWPKACFIWLRRNPLDVIASCKETWGISVAEQLGEPRTPHSYDVPYALDALSSFFISPPILHAVVRYEDLVTQPTKSLRSLCASIGIRFHSAMVEYGRNQNLLSTFAAAHAGDQKIFQHHRPHTSSIGRWQTSLTRDETRAILVSLGSKMFGTHGYEADFVAACETAGLAAEEVPANGVWMDRFRSESVSRNSAHFAAKIGLERVQQDLKTLSLDHEKRGEVIGELSHRIAELEAEIDRRLKELQALYERADVLENERNLACSERDHARAQLEAAEADRAARLVVIHDQGSTIAQLQKLVAETEADRDTRVARIERAGKRHSELEAEIARRLTDLRTLYERANTLENERNFARAERDDTRARLDAAEADRAARLVVIHDQSSTIAQLQRLVAETEVDRKTWATRIESAGKRHGELEAEIARRLTDLQSLYERCNALENERNLAQAERDDTRARLEAAEADRAARLQVIDSQGSQIAQLQRLVAETETDRDGWTARADAAFKRLGAIEPEFDRRLKELHALYERASALENERDLARAERDDARARLEAAEADRAARLEVIVRQGAEVDAFKLKLHETLLMARAANAASDTANSRLTECLQDLASIRERRAYKFLQRLRLLPHPDRRTT